MGLKRGIGLCIILLVAALNLAACATMGDPPPTLYKRLGGREGIALVVGDSSRTCPATAASTRGSRA